MSHNTTTVKNSSPSSDGNINLSLDNLVTGSVSEGDTVVYSSGAWGFTANVEGSIAYLLFGRGESDDYENSGASGSPSTGDVWYFYDSSPDNQIGATLNTTSNWLTSIDLLEGKYIIESQVYCEFSASGRLGVRWYKGSDPITSRGTIGDSLTYSDNQGSYCIGHVTISAGDVTGGTNRIEMKIDGLSNVSTYADQDTTPSQFSYLLILKVS